MCNDSSSSSGDVFMVSADFCAGSNGVVKSILSKERYSFLWRKEQSILVHSCWKFGSDKKSSLMFTRARGGWDDDAWTRVVEGETIGAGCAAEEDMRLRKT